VTIYKNKQIQLGWTYYMYEKNSRAVKKVFDTRPEGTRKTGRSRQRWEDGVIQDIRDLGANNWRTADKARVHIGQSSQ
jgi:hypothetical protein